MPLPNSHVIGAGPAGAARAVEALAMDDACVITAGKPGRIWEPALNTYVDNTAGVVYTGPCRITPERPRPLLHEHGDTQIVINRYIVSVPYTVTGVTKDSAVKLTASTDPGLVGRTLFVRSFINSSNQTALRLICDTAES